jgi:hypothetical protein
VLVCGVRNPMSWVCGYSLRHILNVVFPFMGSHDLGVSFYLRQR